MRRFLLVVTYLLLGVVKSFAACSGSSPSLVAADTSYTEVNACVAIAVDGDTISIPAGTSTWTTKLTVTKAIILKGAGIGSTIIRNGVNPDGRMISMTLVVNKDARITGMTINDNGAAQAQFGVIEALGASGGRLRIDHVKFDHPNGFNVMTYNLRGRFDHNEFVWSTSGSIPIYVFDGGASGYGDESWNNSVTWGSSDFLIVEDNTFTYEASTGFCSDGFRGTRVVYRFNTVTSCSFQNHGTESSGRNRGGRAMEVYGNNVSGTTDTFMALRSGAGLSWGNTGPVGLSAANTDVDRAIAFFTWNGAANGRNRLDINDGGNPFYTGTVACGAGCASLTVTVSPDPGWSTSGNGQWYGAIVRKTSTCGTLQCHSVILSNTSNSLTFSSSGGFGSNLSFVTGDTIEINKLTETIDQPGRGGGQLFPTAVLWSGNSSCTTGIATINTVNPHGLMGGDYVSLYVYSGDNALHGVWLINSIVDSDTFTVNVGCTSTAQGEWFKFPAAWNDQVDFPIYQWLNTTNSANAVVSVHASALSVVRANEHYYNYGGTVQSNPTTPFNGTTGVGVGTIANRPTTCTTGVGYWATDQGSWRTAVSSTGYSGQGKFYRCVSINTWDSGIEPYTYPDPLTVDVNSIVSVVPSSGTQGTTNLSLNITGSLTSWVNGTTVATFNPSSGITVNSTTINSATAATVNITIALGANTGTRTLTMTTNMEVENADFVVAPFPGGAGRRMRQRGR